MLATCVDIDTTFIEAACAESITGAHLRAVYQLITAAPLTPTNSIAEPDGGWHLYYACLSSVIAIFPSQRAKAALY